MSPLAAALSSPAPENSPLVADEVHAHPFPADHTKSGYGQKENKKKNNERNKTAERPWSEVRLGLTTVTFLNRTLTRIMATLKSTLYVTPIVFLLIFFHSAQ